MAEEKRTVSQQVDEFCGQWKLQADVRRSLHQIAKRIVMGAAAVCDRRSEGQRVAISAEATKCGMAIRHHMLCGPGESVCMTCDGEGCEKCGWEGVCGD